MDAGVLLASGNADTRHAQFIYIRKTNRKFELRLGDPITWRFPAVGPYWRSRTDIVRRSTHLIPEGGKRKPSHLEQGSLA